MSASTDKLRLTVSEVAYRPLEVVVGALKKAHIFSLCLCFSYVLNKKIYINLCSMSVTKWYQCVHTSVYIGLVGRQRWQLFEEWLSARPR